MPGPVNQAAVELYSAKAKPASIVVTTVKSLDEALEYAVKVCQDKEKAKPLLDVPGDARKTLAAPAVSDEVFAALAKKVEGKDMELVRSGLRDHLAGLDVGFSVADLAIAETATAVLECEKEDDRLAAMICETHVVALSKSKIVMTSYDAEPFLAKALSRERNFTAFISGPSRTADIERVLTLGVHGPLEMHVALVED
ncbi:MAG: lactate utilization protein [Deltaproteobacteria bacterium]|jgi:L-lactate dehydrogenase complex protein LldG|nr:lactate utilization protein [Deltaproteobacteria bacterium]